jgi:hypothetical protein
MGSQLFKATTKSSKAPDVEPGLADGRFMGVEVKFVEGGSYGDGDRFVWPFTLLDDDGNVLRHEEGEKEGQPIVLDGLTSMSLNAKSKTKPKALRFSQALLTEDEYEDLIDEDPDVEGIDMGPTGPIAGRIAQIDIAIRDDGWPTIVNVLPRRKARRSRSSSTAEA